MRHLITWCPYDDQYQLGVTLEDGVPVKFGGDCLRATLANSCLKDENLRVCMPTMAAHVEAARKRRADAELGDEITPATLVRETIRARRRDAMRVALCIGHRLPAWAL
jgi:hypothetical protein